MLLKPDIITLRTHSDATIAFLHTINETNYEAFKSEAGGGGSYLGIISLGGNYAQFRENLHNLDETNHYMRTDKELVDYVQHIVPDAARNAFVECIRLHHQPNKQLVVVLKPEPDPSLVLVSISYIPHGGPPEATVTGSQVFVGSNEAPSFIQSGTKLSPNVWTHIIIKRKPGAAVSITLNIQGDSATQSLPADRFGIFDAIATGDIDYVQAYLDSNVSPDVTDQNGETAFTCAAESGKTAILRAMLPYHPNVNATWNSYTPLMLAAMGGHADIIRTLLQVPGIDKNKQDDGGRTALHWACRDDPPRVGNADAVRALVEGGVDQSIQDKYCWTAVHHVIHEKHPYHNQDELKHILDTKLD